tara:strand:- start:1470 stop:1616 length:147 start_codon:yes stop_codon:yes gene_type:complete
MTEFFALLECLSLGLLALVLIPNWNSDTKLELVCFALMPIALLIWLYI